MQRNGRLFALIGLLVVLVAVVIYQLRGDSAVPAAAPAPARGQTATPGRKAQGNAAMSPVPSLRFDVLQGARSQPGPPAVERNPFQFQVKAAPPPPPPPKPGTPGSGLDAAGNPIPPPPPPPPPIPFKFIGIVQSPNQKLAVLSDNSTRDVFYGSEGGIIDGRYRILRIGVESIEMAYLDGRGRQTIRLTGS